MESSADSSPPLPMDVENVDESGEAMNETLLGDIAELDDRAAAAGDDNDGIVAALADDQDEEIDDLELDCYPYTFSPLLLFAQQHYFDKGYSNYNSVAQFFSPILQSDDPDHNVDMLHNVLYERKNMLYEDLINHVIDHEMLVTCCIDAHFTAFQMFKQNGKTPALLYYDPLSPHLSLATGDSAKKFAVFKMMKCNYGDGQHIQDNKDHYTGGIGPTSSNSTRRMIYNMWKKIHQTDRLYDVSMKTVRLNLNRYILFNQSREPTGMSTQLTRNTCYFQTYLFAVLCKVGKPKLARDGRSVDLVNAGKLEEVAVRLSRFLLEFFVEETDRGTVLMRPLTNSNFIVDFYRYKSAPYHQLLASFLERNLEGPVPNYEEQYNSVLQYYQETKCLHNYDKFRLGGAMNSSPNTKSLQVITGTEGADRKLARADYYKYRAANFMFGFNSNIMSQLGSFCEFNSLRKNQLLRFYDDLFPILNGTAQAIMAAPPRQIPYRDYYFMSQFEVGSQELIDVHHHTVLIDLIAECDDVDQELSRRVTSVNERLVENTLFSKNNRTGYEKILKTSSFQQTKTYRKTFLEDFMSIRWHQNHIALGFTDINLKEKDVTALTRTVFYDMGLMKEQQHRQSFEFEKECINQMARETLRRLLGQFNCQINMKQPYRVHAAIGKGYTYSKYNTLMHFLNVVQSYWQNPDLSNVSIFGKDIRTLLAVSSQKIFFENHHSGFYHYGPFEVPSSGYYTSDDMDLAVSQGLDHAAPGVSQSRSRSVNKLVLTDRVYEFNHLKRILEQVFESANGIQFKSDNEVLNLCLLSLMLDFGLYQRFVDLLNLPFLKDLQHMSDTRELQVEVANLIYEFDRKNSADHVTRSMVEELVFETSYKFMVNKNFNVRSTEFKLIRALNSDPDYQSYVLLVKIYMSLCNINKSVEVDYYKVQCDGEFRIIIPQNFSKSTSDYLEEMSKRYTFSERQGIMRYDDLPVFDLRPHQPEINLYRVRLDSGTAIQSMVKYIEIKNVFRVLNDSKEQYILFVANNALFVEVVEGNKMDIRINNISVEVATIFFNEAISFVPCFKYTDSEDVVMFTSRNFHFHVDSGGQFATDYYGMRHELIECIASVETYVDLNDDHQFKEFKLSELLTESKTIFYFPNYLLQVSNRQQLINLMDLAIRLRNVPFFILVLFYLERSSINLRYIGFENKVKKITGPWRDAICYVRSSDGKGNNAHYNHIFEKQFIDLNQYRHLPLEDFIENLCENFTKYQRFVDGQYQIIPTKKQKAFLQRLICAEECFHFSEVGSGKTKVILPLLCQTFLSNNIEAHRYLARGGKSKDTLIVLVPEHLVSDARTQVYRYCLNLNFRENYSVYDDIFALKNGAVHFKRSYVNGVNSKKVFVTSFNQLKKALTDDNICAKVYPHRDHILVVADEVDDFLDRNKLVFNICSNKNNAFEKQTLDLFFEVSRAAYSEEVCPDRLAESSSSNPDYWRQLYEKFRAIFSEIQDASRSINKSFGIFNEHTLRHCASNIAHDIEGYKSLIARPYESVNRAMPGSYYSDVERTIFLTYVILTEDIAKYDELFQGERKFISYEYYNDHFVHQLDFDDLVYGHEKLSEICEKVPEARDGLTRFLYEIILRRMEIRDRSRSVNSIDIIFNFDCIGFTGTPFLDNYPTADYIRHKRQDDIPNMISRHFYAYTSENLPQTEFEQRFASFQGQNSNVLTKYVPSDFIRTSPDEMTTLSAIFEREGQFSRVDSDGLGVSFNAIVDLCGIFKRSSIYDVSKCIKTHFGSECFHYLYHIDQSDNSDRVLCLKTGNDIQYDEEFYKYLCKTYDTDLRDRIFFFVDNRNVIGKDIPFQLVYQKHYGRALFSKSVVIAHDVDDFSKIWQAMGRSRTMNQTEFSIYKSDIPEGLECGSARDIRSLELTRLLYVANCDRKMAGNISSIYLTLIALFNLSNLQFYYNDQIVNVFLDKMECSILHKVACHERELLNSILSNGVTAGILQHILSDKFKKSSSAIVAQEGSVLDQAKLENLVRHIVMQKYEQRTASGDTFDDLLLFLSGEQKSLMEISYTKQHQKQKQKQQNKNQDSDAMDTFLERHQLPISFSSDNYFDDCRSGIDDTAKCMFNLPIAVPIFSAQYENAGKRQVIDIYPTLQFLYSHHIQQEYIDDDVKKTVRLKVGFDQHYANFLEAVKLTTNECSNSSNCEMGCVGQTSSITYDVQTNYVRQNPQYTIAALRTGVYIIGMKDQFNTHDLQTNRLRKYIQYVVDETGFVLYDRTASKSVDSFGPYFIEQYLIMELLSKQEVAQNVLEYYVKNKSVLQRGLDRYDEKQGKGFVCWRFLINETAKAMAAAAKAEAAAVLVAVAETKMGATGANTSNIDDMELEESASKKMRHSDDSDDDEG